MISKTRDYTIFKRSLLNRKIDPLNLKKISNSIKLHNMLELRPIIVNKNMEIIDGQHRLEAAMQLGLEVYYLIQENSSEDDMFLLNSCQKQWTSDDYLNHYAKKGNEDYIVIQKLCKKHSINCNEFMNLIGTNGGKIMNEFKKGFFKLKEDEQTLNKILDENFLFINQVKSLIHDKTLGNKQYLNHGYFKIALYKLTNIESFKKDTFILKLLTSLSRVHPCSKIGDYIEMFKSIYNYRNSDPLP